jgi:hypothetical protein
MPYFGHIEDIHGFWSIWCFFVIRCSWNGTSTKLVELISNKHIYSISWMKCRYVGGKYMHFMTANRRTPLNCTSTAMRAPVVCQVQQVQVLDQGSTILASHGFTWRNHDGPQQGERGIGLEATNVCVWGMKFPWVSGLLSKVHPKLLQGCKTDHWATEERKQVHLEWCLWWSV